MTSTHEGYPLERAKPLFHELVHVVQWQRLGVDRFLLAYGIGLAIHGYRESPLEQMAYTLQAAFDTGDLDRDVVPEIERRTEEIWEGVERSIEGA